MRVPQLHKLTSQVFVDVQNSISMALYDAFFVDSFVSHLVFRTARTHKGPNFVQVVKTLR